MKKQSGKKLVEILAVELKEWPEGVHFFGCDSDGEIRAYDEEKGEGPDQYSHDFFPKCSVSPEDRAVGFGPLGGARLVTRSEWEDERAKLEGEKVMRACVEKCEPDSKPKADAQGWVRNRGRKNPFDVCTLVDARLRSGDVVMGKFSENLHWVHTGNNFDVMAYRVNESVDTESPEVTAPVDGPLQWRDRVTEIDRTVEALEEERASLIQKLADEGFKLIKREAVELPDMSDWRNWREGDFIVCTEQHGSGFKKGNIYEISEIVRSVCNAIKVVSDENGQKNGWQPRFFKWHSRPTK